MKPRRGDWMQTASGRQFWPLDPSADEVHIEDIAFALSNLCRYGGHCRQFYSVAEHSVLVSLVCPPELARCGLLHDGTEAYCVDMPRPLKTFIAQYNEIETSLWYAVALRFGLPMHMPDEVKIADNSVLLAEKPVLMGTKHRWTIPGTPADVEIRCLPPTQACELFLERFKALYPEESVTPIFGGLG